MWKGKEIIIKNKNTKFQKKNDFLNLAIRAKNPNIIEKIAKNPNFIIKKDITVSRM